MNDINHNIVHIQIYKADSRLLALSGAADNEANCIKSSRGDGQKQMSLLLVLCINLIPILFQNHHREFQTTTTRDESISIREPHCWHPA